MPNRDEVESLLANNIQDIPPEDTDERAAIAQCVSHFVLVRDLLNSDLQMIKINQPVRDLWKAQDGQSVALDIVTFSADHYSSQVPTPSEMDIKNQFDSFSDRVSGEQTFGAADDPMGFGYKYPNRVKIQYIGLKAADVYNAAKAGKSLQDWYIAAYQDYKANRDVYDAQPIATPTTRPGTTTAPSAQHADDLDQDFALHVQIVLDHLYQQAADDLHQKLLHQISDALTAGYAAWHDAQNAGAASAPSVNAYIDMSFIQDLAQTIQKENGVLPVVGSSDQFKGTRELVQMPEIGLTSANSMTNQTVMFAQYAVVDPNQGGLQLWQPSEAFRSAGGDSYIFRITQVDPSHTPPLAEVRDTVINDCKLSAAFKLASDAAKNLVADAQKHPWATVTSGMPVITTDLFRPAEIVAHPMQNGGIPPLRLTPQSIYLLAKDSQQLVSAVPGADGRPVDVAELWPNAIVAAIHLQQATPMWTASMPSLADLGAYRLALRDAQLQMIAQLCTKDAAAHRMNFQLAAVNGSGPPQ